MEKEKLIEEMAKVLANASCKGYECENCFFEDKVESKTNCVCVKALYNAGYRKQEDILHEWVERETTYLKEIAELKKELDRLKKFELYRIKAMKEDKDEIERLTKERDMYADDLYWKAEVRKREDFITELTVENAELQKQVDELKQENSVLSVTIGLQEEIEKQAVKDTAKEIYSEINSCIEKGQEYCGLDWRGLLTAKTLILVYCKKKGVEVE